MHHVPFLLVFVCPARDDDMRPRRQLPKRNTRLFLLRHPLALSLLMSVSPQCPNWAPFFGFAGVASAVRAAPPARRSRRC
jgi:hypothetical protein